jgi:hypothetical protein
MPTVRPYRANSPYSIGKIIDALVTESDLVFVNTLLGGRRIVWRERVQRRQRHEDDER